MRDTTIPSQHDFSQQKNQSRTLRINSRHSISSQRQRSTILCNTANDSVYQVAALQDRSTIVKIIDQEDLIRLALEATNERPYIVAQRIHSDEHWFTGCIGLQGHKVEQRGTSWNFAPTCKPESRSAESSQFGWKVVQESRVGVTEDHVVAFVADEAARR